METKLNIQIIIGSTRQNRFSEKPARYIFDELKKKENVNVELVDLRDWPLPFFDEPMSPFRLNGNYSNEMAKKWSAKINEADAFIMVAPEYNHGYPAVLKNAIDCLGHEWKDKPVGFVSYGSAGGARCIEQLRQVVIELKMHPIKSSIHLPSEVYFGAMKENVPVPTEIFQPIREGMGGDRVELFFNELIHLGGIFKGVREAVAA